MKSDILITGVGGQGVVFASRLLAVTALKAGFFVRTSETIGMAQRGGAVVSHVRIGSENQSPIIPLGTADLLIGFELIEAVRNLPRLSKNGVSIVNTDTIIPSPYLSKQSLIKTKEYIKAIQEYSPRAIHFIDDRLLSNADAVNLLNVYILGIAAHKGLLPFNEKALEETIRQEVSSKHVDSNLRVLHQGALY